MPLCFSAAHVHRLIEMGRTWSICIRIYEYIRSHIVAWELKAQSFSRHKWFPTCSCKGRIWDATSSSLQPSLTLIVRATLFGVSRDAFLPVCTSTSSTSSTLFGGGCQLSPRGIDGKTFCPFPGLRFTWFTKSLRPGTWHYSTMSHESLQLIRLRPKHRTSSTSPKAAKEIRRESFYRKILRVLKLCIMIINISNTFKHYRTLSNTIKH